MELVSNKETTVAVLPFQILGEADKLSPVILGFTEDLIVNFSKFIGLSVISQYSSLGISSISDTSSISQLGTDYIITGSFRSLEKGFRIGIKLIRTRDNKVVFAGNHDENLETILHTQDTVTQQIVNVLQQQINHDLLSYSYKKESVDLAAYENWLLGMNLLKKGSVESDLRARAHFEAALRIDPQYARAYSGISLSYFNEWSCQLWDRWEISQKGAHEYALKAIELDENDYISLAVLGRTFLYLGDYDKSEHFLRKSLRMNPNDADNLILIAFCLVYLGHAKEAEALYLKAKNLNPLHPDVYFPHASFIYFELGDYQKSVEFAEKVSDASVWTDFSAYVAAAYYHLSEPDKMNSYWKKYLELFQRNINKGKEPNNQEALEWQITVNPYKVKSHLEPFWEYMGRKKTLSLDTITSTNASISTKGSFVNTGELWELDYSGESALLKDSKGLHDIAKLLEQPEKQIHCAELMGSVLESEGADVIDGKAMKDYKSKIQALQSDILDAEEMGHTSKAEEFRTAYETLLNHLSQVTGMSNKTRKTGSSLEKARSAVTWRIRSSIKKIEKVHPKLAKHLTNSIKTGTFCSYVPESPHAWSI
ncbi:tetratricopeptide repeat protein [Flagellimonas sp.]|uniref:tetratricopeptide repeat protein n=1 Tax=Flagellimonas sp. TaxID=2058762 RepID=UPI003B598F0F